MNGNFHFLSFGSALTMSQKWIRLNLVVALTIRFNKCDSWRLVCEKWALEVAIYSIFAENTVGFETFSREQSFNSLKFNTSASKFNLCNLESHGKSQST